MSVMKTEDPTIVKWRIYYDDKSTFSSVEGTAAEAPSAGVIAIVQKEKDSGWVVTAFKDYYWYENDEWWGGDAPGFWQHMFKGGAKIVKFGVTTTAANFNETMVRAAADQEFAIKTGKGLLEPGVAESWSDPREHE